VIDMNRRIPDADRTPNGPAYEGRLLVRPDDEVVDQGAGFDMDTLITRRRVLSLVGLGVGAATLAACGGGTTTSATADVGSTTATGSGTSTTTSSTATSSTTAGEEIPEETNGPYPADGTTDLNVLEESGIVRRDITSSLDGGTTVDGVPLGMTFSVVDMANGNVPFEGAAVYAWQCDAEGRYSMYSQGVEDETFLRGIQAADANGDATFTTIVPGCYSGRWTHIHFEVYPDTGSATDVGNVIATSQVAFPADMLADVYARDGYSGSKENLAGVGSAITDDNIFSGDDWELHVPEVAGDPDSGYTAQLIVRVDTTTAPTGASGGGPGGGPGGAPPGG